MELYAGAERTFIIEKKRFQMMIGCNRNSCSVAAANREVKAGKSQMSAESF